MQKSGCTPQQIPKSWGVIDPVCLCPKQGLWKTAPAGNCSSAFLHQVSLLPECRFLCTSILTCFDVPNILLWNSSNIQGSIKGTYHEHLYVHHYGILSLTFYYRFFHYLSIHFFLVGLGFEFRALHLQRRLSTAWATPPVNFALVILEMGVLWTIFPGWPWTLILPISC
jgi:hypothetical protein